MISVSPGSEASCRLQALRLQIVSAKRLSTSRTSSSCFATLTAAPLSLFYTLRGAMKSDNAISWEKKEIKLTERKMLYCWPLGFLHGAGKLSKRGQNYLPYSELSFSVPRLLWHKQHSEAVVYAWKQKRSSVLWRVSLCCPCGGDSIFSLQEPYPTPAPYVLQDSFPF